MKDPQTMAYLATFQEEGIPTPETEYRFHPKRRWRFDFAWPLHRVALEIEGGVFGKKGKRCPTCKLRGVGAHNSVKGILRDIDKYNAAQVNQWAVVRCIPTKRTAPETYETIRRVLATHCFKLRAGE